MWCDWGAVFKRRLFTAVSTVSNVNIATAAAESESSPLPEFNSFTTPRSVWPCQPHQGKIMELLIFLVRDSRKLYDSCPPAIMGVTQCPKAGFKIIVGSNCSLGCPNFTVCLSISVNYLTTVLKSERLLKIMNLLIGSLIHVYLDFWRAWI